MGGIGSTGAAYIEPAPFHMCKKFVREQQFPPPETLYKREGMDTSKPIKTINWSLFAALLVFLFILLLLSRCHPNVGVAVPPGASSTAPAALPQGARFVENGADARPAPI